MIHEKLLNPKSILVVGGSDNIEKPGGKLLKNIIDGGFGGDVFVLNPGRETVQNKPSFANVADLPGNVDLAILAVASNLCVPVVKELAETRNTRGFIIISAGFSEEGEEGKRMEKELADIINGVGGTLIGPNCIGVVTPCYNGIFTYPVPKVNPHGCDFVTGSGATAVFIFDSALPKGISFSSIFSVGNGAQTGIEEVLEYWDNTFDPEKSSKIKMIYLEDVKNPDKMLKHASSLIRKGCKIAAIKSGSTDAGKRATSSHTGAMASSDSAVEALFRKAGIVRCFGREELTTVISVFMCKEMTGKNMAIITHAGGPGVMLTDALAAGGISIPKIEGEHHDKLLAMLNPGSSAANPIDILATGTPEQLGNVIDYCDKQMDDIQGMSVIFGSPGLTSIAGALDVINQKIVSSSKPVYPILPALNTAREEVMDFLAKGHVNFPDEVTLGRALTTVYNTPKPAEEKIFFDNVNIDKARQIIDCCENGFQPPHIVNQLLEAAGIPTAKEGTAQTEQELMQLIGEIGYPVVMKVVGPVHKSDVGGVTLNIKSDEHLKSEYQRMMKIKDVTGVLVQKMAQGMELFIGAKYEPKFGHIMLCGLGGIFVETLGDISSGLAPLTLNEAHSMVRNLKAYRIIKGMRGKEGANEDKFAEIIVRLSTLLRFAVEIKEIDLNPLLGNATDIIAVDARILIEK
ncbi:MAG: acetate--CoA ligase family protein [Cytophagaceae bacterium]|jgi:acetyltransferase|nr:acetate--CoA ligase family protein [Cytophagaceae bacterium]